MKTKCIFYGLLLTVLAVLFPRTLHANHLGHVSGLNEKEFKKYWTIESESPDYQVRFLGDTLEVVSPKGMTVWRNEKLSGKITIEYDACLMDEGQEGDRVSDLNCFWMATDPKHPNNIFARKKWRSGVFLKCYTLQLYYLGYGGNSNRTTRFRRYDGDERGVTEAKYRPAILKEYLDKAYMNIPNQWRHIRITSDGQRTCYYIDDELIVDFRDPNPLQEGWFGFRTTWSRARLTNFRYTIEEPKTNEPVALQWIEQPNETAAAVPVSFGVPFAKGSVKTDDKFAVAVTGDELAYLDVRPLAYWQDGSVKWAGFSGTLPLSEQYQLRKLTRKEVKKIVKPYFEIEETERQYVVDNGKIRLYVPKTSAASLIDSMQIDNQTVALSATLVTARGSQNTRQNCVVEQTEIERKGDYSAVIKIQGHQWTPESDTDGKLPFEVRLYLTAGSAQVRMQHTFIYDFDDKQPLSGHSSSDYTGISALGLRFDVPMREALYNRHVAFVENDSVVWHEAVQPLVGRRELRLSSQTAPVDGESLFAMQQQCRRIPEYDAFDKRNQSLIDKWATWDGFRLSQLNDMSYTIRKRAKDQGQTPWIGTHAGHRAEGTVCVGDVSGGLAVGLHDFWQSCPSTLEVNRATQDIASLYVWLWSPEGEMMDMRHYDNEEHGLNAAYEDVQEGLNTPYGIARTSVLTFQPLSAFLPAEDLAQLAPSLSDIPQLMCTPAYLHQQQAFGIWSLPKQGDSLRSYVEEQLTYWAEFYREEIDRRHWYGFWNYGDVMHAYNQTRGEWLYDVGGFAWDNTELASNSFLWYNFLRTGRADYWRMAVAMTWHTAEVDVYHVGPYAGLGTRHNVTHWGCGAKEARVSQAAWNRFYYYLSGGNERVGDLMTAQRDVDTLLYHLDPMRLAQPRELHPCTAPARLRIGPDWLAYVGNWMTEWERTGNVYYRDKIIAGMQSINALPNGIFTGPKALGYDPATGVITYEGDPSLQNTNHLLPIMGGFELMNELMLLLPEQKEWEQTWLTFCRDYRIKADTISKNTFLIPRLHAYAASHLYDSKCKEAAWKELMIGVQKPRRFSTNGVATWALDAIYMLEVIP